MPLSPQYCKRMRFPDKSEPSSKYYYDLAYEIGEKYFDKILLNNILSADVGIYINTRNIKKTMSELDFAHTMNVMKNVYVHWNVVFLEKKHWWYGKEIHIVFQSKKTLFETKEQDNEKD